MKKSFLALFLLATAPAFANSVVVNDNPSDADGWFDITVYKAHVRQDLTLRTFDQVQNCDKTDDKTIDMGTRGGRHRLETFDCSAYIGRRLNAKAFKYIPAWTFDNGRLTSYQLDTPLVEVLTVVPEDKLATADFLGFSEAHMGGRVNLFRATGDRGETREAGRVRLKDGRVGVLHRWFATFEQSGNSGSNVIRSLPFKPVLVRIAGNTYNRYWDKLIGTGFGANYNIANYVMQQYPPYYVFGNPNYYNRESELVRY